LLRGTDKREAEVNFNLPIYHLLFLSAAFFCQGCTVLSYGTFSAPVVPASEAKMVSNEDIHWSGRQFGDKIQVREVTLAVLPQNQRVWFNIWGIIVPFLPLPGGSNQSEFYASRQKRGPLFLVTLIITPQADDFTFDPKGVSLSLPSGAELNPSAFWGPQWRGLKANSLDGCHPLVAVNTRGPISTAQTIDHLEIREDSCFTFLFDTAPPSPDQVFSLSITGIRKGGQAFAMPPIRFQRHSRWQFELVLVQ
jgi:hypothetical protein